MPQSRHPIPLAFVLLLQAAAGEGPPLPSPPMKREGPPLVDGILKWSRGSQTNTVKFGTLETSFSFGVTNVSTGPVTITAVNASCGCTVPKLPALPWTLAPDGSGIVEVTMNLAGKRDTVAKPLTVLTDRGYKTLEVEALIEGSPAAAMDAETRQRNVRIASVFRQAVFQGDCASCHATPAQGKLGAELYQAACVICHEADHRAGSVPELGYPAKPADAAYWRNWVSSSAEGKLMPAFAVEQGGILSAAQIDSLVTYLTGKFPSTPKP